MMPKIRKIALIYILVFFILDAFALCRPSSGQAVSRLDNGLRVIVKEDHRNPIVVFSVFLGVGSACEEGYLGSGISHLIEHMLFKGTRKYPLEAIEEILNRYGGKIEGFTSFDYTGYRITILKEHADTAIDILKEMLTAPTFDPGELKKEKQVIKREMDLSRDDPGKRLSRLTFSNAYLTHPYAIPVIGYKDNFDRLGQEDLIDFFRSNYTPEKMVISVVGDIDTGETYEKIQRQFGAMPRGNNIIPVLPEEPQQIAEKYIEEAIDIEGAYLNIAFHSTAFADKNLYALDLLSYILGEGEGSILNKKIRLEQGLVLSISAYNYTPKYPGLFVVSSVLKENKGREALEAILKELEDIKKNGVREEDLTRAKNNFLAGYIYQKETIESQANDLAIGELLTGNPHFFEIYIERIKSVRPDEIKAAANKYLDTQAMTVVALSKSGNIINTEKDKVISLNDRNITRVELQNKLPVLISENPSFPMVSIVILLKGGLLLERPDNNGISMLTGLMLMDGTDTMTREDIARLYESRGMSIDTYSANNSMGITINCLKEHTELAFNIASELCRRSVFPETELRREKDEMNSAIDMQDNQ
ncbi:MAG: insulinase family protein, partial [Candidatus Omnitrophica bacterium]|nr:insulinase family protein [Candidatus Omnitrophota bacterium]